MRERNGPLKTGFSAPLAGDRDRTAVGKLRGKGPGDSAIKAGTRGFPVRLIPVTVLSDFHRSPNFIPFSRGLQRGCARRFRPKGKPAAGTSIADCRSCREDALFTAEKQGFPSDRAGTSRWFCSDILNVQLKIRRLPTFCLLISAHSEHLN